MRITPLVRHAQAYLPRLTSLFSDVLDVTTLDVVTGGTCTLNLGTTHGLSIGEQYPVVITTAETPNPITAAVVNADDSVTLTTELDHDITTTPNPLRADPWDTEAKLSGFDSADMNGTLALVSAPDRKTIIVTPTDVVASITLNGNETLLKVKEREIVGWYSMLAATSTTLTFDAPTSATRSYTVQTPEAAANMRVFGALDLEEIMKQYVRADNTPIPVSKAVMYVTPVSVDASRSKHSGTDLIADISENTDIRLQYKDGFDVFVALPAEHTVSGIDAIDLAQGDVLSAVLGAFMGLKIERPELCASQSYVAIMAGHEAVAYTKANYIHKFGFTSQFVVVNDDTISALNITEQDGTTGGSLPTELLPVGAPALQDIAIDGITHDAMPGKLTANIKLDE